MTKITEQLEAFNKQELEFIKESYEFALEKVKKDLEDSKSMIGYIKAIKDLTSAYFPDSEVKTGNLERDGSILELSEKTKELSEEYNVKAENTIKMYESILAKISPLIDLVNE